MKFEVNIFVEYLWKIDFKSQKKTQKLIYKNTDWDLFMTL